MLRHRLFRKISKYNYGKSKKFDKVWKTIHNLEVNNFKQIINTMTLIDILELTTLNGRSLLKTIIVNLYSTHKLHKISIDCISISDLNYTNIYDTQTKSFNLLFNILIKHYRLNYRRNYGKKCCFICHLPYTV
jgi:hypothetical protein